jgi:hypothetical protein
MPCRYGVRGRRCSGVVCRLEDGDGRFMCDVRCGMQHEYGIYE